MKKYNYIFYIILILILIIIIFIKFNKIIQLFNLNNINKLYKINQSKNIFYQKKTVLITGGARGIGEAYAIALLERKYKVIIIDKLNAEKKANELSLIYGKDNVIGIKCDVTDIKEYRNAFNKASSYSYDGILDIVIFNAGILREFFDDSQKLIETNLLAPINGSEMYIKQITNSLTKKSQKQGIIIITSSKAGIIPFDSDLSPVYNASKAGINQYVRSMSSLSKRYNFRINAICPSFVNTEMNHPYIRTKLDKLGTYLFLNSDNRGGILQPVDITHSMLRIIDDKNINCELIEVSNSVGLEGKIVPYDPCNAYKDMGLWLESQSIIDKLVVDYRLNKIDKNKIWSKI